MRICLSTYLLALASCLVAADSYPPDAQRAVDNYSKATEEARKTYDSAMAKARDVARKDLEKAIVVATKKGDLDAANAIKSKLDELASGQGISTDDKAASNNSMALIKSIIDGDMTEAQWMALNGQEVICKAAEWTDLKVTLVKGQQVVVVPHPTDTWQSSAGSKKATYAGESYKQGEWNRMSMIVRVGEAPESIKRIADEPMAPGPGKIYVNAHDTGSPNRIGTIRVKVVLIR